MLPPQGKYLHLLSPQHNTCDKLTKNVTTRDYFRLSLGNEYEKK